MPITEIQDVADWRSDTVTKPVPAMREAMARAPVGDDVYGEDSTVNSLQERCAALLGKEAALFVPSGTMANQIAVSVLARRGDEVIVEAMGHSFNFESGALGFVAGVQARPVITPRGVMTAAQIEEALRGEAYWLPHTGLIIVENTHNFGGGTVYPLTELQAIAETARGHGVPVHMDGARLFNAVAASGVSAKEYAARADTVCFCFSKGLGAPVGSILAGSREFIREAHRLRKMLGGGMRQAGILAAACHFALDHHVERLREDHERARALAAGLEKIASVQANAADVQTNILFVGVDIPGATAEQIAHALRQRGVLVSPAGPGRLRLVSHLDIHDRHVAQTLRAFEETAEWLREASRV